MRSTTFAILGSVSIAVASPWGYEAAPQPTITVTSCPNGGGSGAIPPQAPYNDASPYHEAITVTVTETSTVTSLATPESSAAAVYTNLPPKPGMSTTWIYPSGPGAGSAASTGFGTATGSATTAKQTFHVQVGTFGDMVKFVPNNINAKIGDVVEFDFLAKSHSLTQSEFLTPCTYNGGFDTGLNQPNPMNISGLHVVPLIVGTEMPQWFYCKQQGPPNHCGKGMVFGLNPGNKMDQFIQNAINQNGALNNNATSTTSEVTATSIASSTAAAATTTITVGLNGGQVLKFDPPYLPKVTIGDKLHFDFRALNHTLTESSLEAPCAKLTGTEVDTNFQNVNKMDIPNFKPFDLTITEDKPRFFYCKQANRTPKGHCGKGMVFAVNVDAATFATFEQNAEATGLLPVPMRKRFMA